MTRKEIEDLLRGKDVCFSDRTSFNPCELGFCREGDIGCIVYTCDLDRNVQFRFRGSEEDAYKYMLDYFNQRKSI